MGKKPKHKNKMKRVKTTEQRKKEVDKIKNNLELHGLSESFENIKVLYTIFDNYINDGIPVSGKMPLHGLKREVHYILTSKPHIVNTVFLKYNEFI